MNTTHRSTASAACPAAGNTPRRTFLKRSAKLAAAAALVHTLPARAAQPTRYRAAVIGHTGRGDYGHGLDLIFEGHPAIEVVAVADPDPTGRERARVRCHAPRGYADYRELIARERPQLVSIAPRWTEDHAAVGQAALEAGAHLFVEKPFTTTLAEADRLLALAGEKKLKITVAHQMRLAPAILLLKSKVGQGLIGDLLALRAHGKQDSRAGGEDLLVLGIHIFDLMRFFGGDAQWCTARVRQAGHPISVADAHAVREAIGPVAGDEIEAQFAFANGMNGSFVSRGGNRQTAGPWGLELIGSKGKARVLADIFPRVYVWRANSWTPAGRQEFWERLPDDPTVNAAPAEQSVAAANRRLVDDWLTAIETDREPVCSGHAAMKALEMVMAVYRAGLSGTRVPFPLKSRQHPLAPSPQP